jgi:hypothetical protein
MPPLEGEAVMATLKDFDDWLQEIARYGNIEDHVEDAGLQFLSSCAGEIEAPGEVRRTIRIYTDVNSYHITAVERATDDKGYLGCISTCRKPRAGEDWHRGSDLPDGPLSRETWHRILANIVSYEMVRVHKRQEPRGVPDTPGEEITGPDLQSPQAV